MEATRVKPVDLIARNMCLICAQHRRLHLATTDHSFVPSDSWTVELTASELQPGDTIAQVPVQRTSSHNEVESKFWVYRRR